MSVLGFKRIVLGVLAILLIVVWIRNLLLLLPTKETVETTQTGGRAMRASVLPARGSDDIVFALDSNIRDPFLLPRTLPPKNATRTTPAPIPRPVESIRASLKGHVLNATQSYIVALDSLTGNIALYRIGDSLNGFHLNRITRSEIQWKSRKGRRLVWKTSP